MSPVGRALQAHFVSVSRQELDRLKRKTASLRPEDRAEVDALTLAVAQGIASRLDSALEAPGTGDLASVVLRLFAGPANSLEERS